MAVNIPTTGAVITLKLTGPTSFPEGRRVGGRLNGIVANYNTILERTADDIPDAGKRAQTAIRAEVGDVE
jgi:hypothetical protein